MPLRKCNVTTHLRQRSRVKFAGWQLAALVREADIDLSGAKSPSWGDGKIRYLKHGKELVSLVKRECEQRHENSSSLPQTSLPPVVSGTSCNRVLVRLLFIE